MQSRFIKIARWPTKRPQYMIQRQISHCGIKKTKTNLVTNEEIALFFRENPHDIRTNKGARFTSNMVNIEHALEQLVLTMHTSNIRWKTSSYLFFSYALSIPRSKIKQVSSQCRTIQYNLNVTEWKREGSPHCTRPNLTRTKIGVPFHTAVLHEVIFRSLFFRSVTFGEGNIYSSAGHSLDQIPTIIRRYAKLSSIRSGKGDCEVHLIVVVCIGSYFCKDLF